MNVKNITEVLFHSSPSPLNQKDLNHVLGDNKIKIEDIVKEINSEYDKDDKGLVIEKIAGGYQLLSKKEYHFYVEKLLKEIKKPRFSSAAMETLSIIAYKQPVTRIEIEHIRGVDSSGVIRNLLDKGLLRIKGRDETLGRALLYKTTPIFLELFGLDSLKDLPTLEELTELMDEGTQLTPIQNEN
jgi:segregation and condensation protein B